MTDKQFADKLYDDLKRRASEGYSKREMNLAAMLAGLLYVRRPSPEDPIKDEAVVRRFFNCH